MVLFPKGLMLVLVIKLMLTIVLMLCDDAFAGGGDNAYDHDCDDGVFLQEKSKSQMLVYVDFVLI